MLLSDRDIKASIAEGRLGLEPYDAGLVQPSSIDVRLDRFFRVFNNSRYTHIDPALQQDDLTTLVEPDGDEPFVLHPGEFVLGSTLEVVTLPDDLAARLEGKSLAGPARAAHPLHRRVRRPGVLRPHHAGAVQRGQPADHAVAGHEDRPALHVPAHHARPSTRTARPSTAPGTRTSAARRRPGPTATSPARRPVVRRVTCTLTGASAPATSRTSVAVGRSTTSPGRTGSPRRRRTARRVMNQPVTVEHDDAGEHQDEHPARSCRWPPAAPRRAAGPTAEMR